MKYFYHIGEFIVTKCHQVKDKIVEERVWSTSNYVKEVTFERYSDILLIEESIKQDSGLPGWHFPFQCEDLPSNKVMFDYENPQKPFRL